MAAEAVASSSNHQTHSSPAIVTSPTSWAENQAFTIDYYNWFRLQNYYSLLAVGWVTPPAQLQDRTLRKRKAPSPNEVISSQHGANVLNGDSTRLFDRRGRVTFKPYSDIKLDSSLSSLPGEHYHQTKRRHLDGLRGTNGLHGLKQGSSLSKKTQVIQPDRGCTIGNLFPEVLSIIFEYLDEQSKGRVAQVSTRWRDAAYKKSVWKGMTARLHLNKSNPTLFQSLVTRGIKDIQILSIRKSIPKDLVSGIPNLQSLNLSGCFNLSDANIESTFCRNVYSLKTLDLSFCKEITDHTLARIYHFCKSLEKVDLAGCSKITDSGLMFLASELKNLKDLNLRSCRQISDKGLQYLCTGPDSKLETLSLQDCQKLTDDSLRSIAQGMPNLKNINLSFCVSITDTGLKSLATMSNLEAVNLRTCDNVSDIGIGFLAENENLTTLDISFCGNITDASLRHMASSNSLGNSLKSLSVTTCAITDEGLSKMAKSLVKLKELHMGQCVKISDSSLEAIASHMKELNVIDLYGCPNISGEAIEKLRKKLPKLQKLNLAL